jgi:hypothetical protein
VTTTGTLLSAFESRTQYSSMASGGNGETLSDATWAILKCAETIPALYQLQETNTSFKDLRSACFYEAMLYGNQISPVNVSFVERVRYIVSTYREAVYLSSYSLFKALPAAFTDVESGGTALDWKHNVVRNRLINIDRQIQEEKNVRKANNRQSFFSRMIPTGFLGRTSELEIQSFEILQSSLRDLIQLVNSMQEFIQKMLELARLVRQLERRGQWEQVTRSVMAGNKLSIGQHRELTYLEVLGAGATFIRDCEALRSGSKRLIENLGRVRDYVPEKVQTSWFQDIKQEGMKRASTS